ncbi:hypothetical protein D4764_06G0007700 [Takifugu flavidus]|uniref:Uncharacterized protein n=1 Tax=Takifugu flavidus TaxID=433684 RepID=A0A5C6N0J0_9TELE|nr:hypothetical protein D4764_06G0007700 [Takifugu flavidus]
MNTKWSSTAAAVDKARRSHLIQPVTTATDIAVDSSARISASNPTNARAPRTSVSHFATRQHRLPKLEHDSEREFTDLKMALDYLLGPHPQLSEYYKYRVLMEQLVLEEA